MSKRGLFSERVLRRFSAKKRRRRRSFGRATKSAGVAPRPFRNALAEIQSVVLCFFRVSLAHFENERTPGIRFCKSGWPTKSPSVSVKTLWSSASNLPRIFWESIYGYAMDWVAVISAENHKRQRSKRQPVTAKWEKSQTPKVLTAILTLPNLT